MDYPSSSKNVQKFKCFWHLAGAWHLTGSLFLNPYTLNCWTKFENSGHSVHSLGRCLHFIAFHGSRPSMHCIAMNREDLKEAKLLWQTWPFWIEFWANHSYIVRRRQNLKKWHFVSKIVLTYYEKKLFYWSKKLLKFEAEGREFANFLRSPEQFIQTVKGQNNFW